MKKCFTLLIMVILGMLLPVRVYAVNTAPTAEQKDAAEERKRITVESNLIPGWPQGPLIGAESAILVDAESGAVLYEKNVNERLYPASTTKLMTALLTIENTAMNDVVTFSHDAIFNIESSSSRIGIDEGEELTVEQCLYGLLLGSGNEVAYALAEHVAGDMESFVNMMNERAAALGCTNTHFVNSNGLPDPEHYVSALDLSIIARACFKNESLVTISGTSKYTIPPTNIQPEERYLENHHLMVKGLKYAYDGFVGGKTGYTREARQTLVSCAERDGVRLICIIMKEESPNQFLDTAALFDYGFDGFKKLNIAENEDRYAIDFATFFKTNLDIIGSSKPLLTINPSNCVVIPKSTEFKDLTVEVSYDSLPKNSVASLSYSLNGHNVGYATIDYSETEKSDFEFSNVIKYASMDDMPESVRSNTKRIFVRTERLMVFIVVILVIILLVFFIRNIYLNRKHNKMRNMVMTKNNYKKRKKRLRKKKK
ncbi:MAG: D-alanyl-D-alanine carboxypeptidase [Lachnospiraceae bacterium]|nr:D-alanyl-D-alanine carboxypeptidase [Lachnospiraceae bacterium]